MKKILAILWLFTLADYSQAQAERTYETAEERSQRISKTKPMPNEYYAELVGKMFWYRPGTEQYPRYRLHLSASPDRHGIVRYEQEIFPSSLTKFEILEVLVLGKSRSGLQDAYVYKLRLEDGTMAYMEASSLGTYTGLPRRQLVDNVMIPDPVTMARNLDSASYGNIYVFAEDPREILERYSRQQREKSEELERERLAREVEVKKAEQARIAVAKANAKKGGVRIGMTKKQVLASNWGSPDDVNRTTTVAGSFEQWVYDGSYLYFQNGILTTIQN